MTGLCASLAGRLALLWLCALLAGGAVAAEPDRRPTWASLTPAQKQALAPLQQDWPTIELQRKNKWLELAARFPKLPAEERQRVQERMAEWARLSPNQRGQARLQFQEAQQIPSEERQTRWEAYQALSPEERNKLAQSAKPVAKAAASSALPPASPSTTAGTAAGTTAGKRNPGQTQAAAPLRAVSPTVVQAKPGATTTSMTTRAAPPPHHQPGMPKIAARPGDVDPATLLPQRGPQAAEVRTAASNDPSTQP